MFDFQERKSKLWFGISLPAQCQQAKGLAAVGREEEISYFQETRQANEMFLFREVGKKGFTSIARRNSGRQDNSSLSLCGKQSADCFGKDCVGVDVAFGGEREAVALAKEFTDAIGIVNGGDELGVQGGVLLDEFGNEPGAGGLVRGLWQCAGREQRKTPAPAT